MTDHGGTEARPQRKAWAEEEDEALAQYLADGTRLRVIAAKLGRSMQSVQTRARRMLPEDDPRVPAGNEEVLGWLRAQIQHGYDWKAALSRRHATANGGTPWTWEENKQLISEIRNGLTWPQIAQQHSRTVSAVEAQASHLVVPLSEEWTRKSRLIFLRKMVIERPEYDWATALRTNASASFPFSPRDDETLRQGWQQHTPLAELADGLELPELVIARQLTALGLAANLVEVTDRLGCTPNGPVDRRRRLTLDPSNPRHVSRVFVLVAGAIDGGDDQLVSIHREQHEADAAAQDLAERGLTPQIYPRTFTFDDGSPDPTGPRS